MLEPAIKYIEQLTWEQYDTWFNDKYKYWQPGSYGNPIEIATDIMNEHQFVSVSDDEVIGYIGYEIDRETNAVDGLNVVNFSNNKVTFGMDLGQALKDIFEKYHFRKLSFSVVVGNPIEKSYDRMIKKYGGRIVGIKKEEVKLCDGKYYDEKMYEIFSDEYFSSVSTK